MLVYFGEYAYNPCYIGLYSVFDVKTALLQSGAGMQKTPLFFYE